MAERLSFAEHETVWTVLEMKCNLMVWQLKRFTAGYLSANVMVQCLVSNMENAWRSSQPMSLHEVLTLKVSIVLFIMTLQKTVRPTNIAAVEQLVAVHLVSLSH